MNDLVAAKQNEIAALCVRHHVVRLELFGSAASGAFDGASSDLDFLVEFRPMPPAEHADCFFGLQADLEHLFGVPVDLVEPGPIRNPYFRQAIEQTRVVVYAAA